MSPREKGETKILSVTAFRRQAAQILARVTENREPIILTQNGLAVGVVLSPDTYGHLVELARRAYEAEVIAAVQKGRKAVKEGDLHAHDDLMAEMAAWLKGKRRLVQSGTPESERHHRLCSR